MILHIAITSDPDSPEDSAERITHYLRRVELPDESEAISRLSRALDNELARPARKPRSDAGKRRTKETP